MYDRWQFTQHLLKDMTEDNQEYIYRLMLRRWVDGEEPWMSNFLTRKIVRKWINGVHTG